MNVVSIPAHLNFLEELAQGILQESKSSGIDLPDYKILLPNRRSCQNLRDTFLDKTDGQILLLPQIRPLGDVDEEELYFANSADIAEQLSDIPPALSPVRRLFLLTRLIRKMEAQNELSARPLDQILQLAQALALLLDQIIIEELSFSALENIVPEEFASHWQITLNFLNILSKTWPHILEEQGVIESADRRNRLLHIQANSWQENAPENPIIVAGSTGTMPATARLMKVIANLPKGRVVLPSVDLKLDRESWEAMESSHPQSLFKDLFQKLDINREGVQNFVRDNPNNTQKQLILTRDIMRPADTVHLWQNPTYKILEEDLQHLSLYECDTLRQEAFVIALKLREVLEDKSKTAALVTPDRQIASQVKLICKRWGLELDDTGGTPLNKTETGRFLELSLKVFIDNFSPSLLLSLLKNPLCHLGLERSDILKEIGEIDIALRGPASQNPLATCASYKSIQTLEQIKTDNHLFLDNTSTPLKEFIDAHLKLLNSLTATIDQEVEPLWFGEEGEAAANFFQKLMQDSQVLDELTPSEYLELFSMLLRGVLIRPKYGTHPRLLIMGQIEARLMKADVMILSGLNESIWPSLPSTDPWMSRPMREEFGLPDLERSIALAAHDFIQAFSSKEVVLTRTLRQDGTPTVPARWLQRLDIILRAHGHDENIIRKGPLKNWAIQIDLLEKEVEAATRPQPKPKCSKRPVSLPVTAIETWMRDPYSLYAKYILGLRSLEDVEQQSDAAQRGSWLHSVFEWFVKSHPKSVPDNAEHLMFEYAISSDKIPKDIELFTPRLKRLISWFIAQEKTWRKSAIILPNALEVKGNINLGNFKLTAKADRIDAITENGGGAIIDYKTGRIPSNTDIVNGLSPQMPLEGAILSQGGFSNIDLNHVESLYFWKVSGGLEPGEDKEIKGRNVPEINELIKISLEGLENLIKEFSSEETPYISLPDTSKAPPEEWQDYAHLARVQEWATIEEGEV